MRAVIRVKKDADVNALLKVLYKYTELEVTFGINMVVIADGKPQQLGLMDIIRHYVKYQQQLILKRTLFDLEQAEKRSHVLEGLIVAVQNIDEVIAIIKQSEGTSDARERLMKRFEITEIQAQAILDLKLARLTRLEVFKLEEELKELQKLIKKLTAISKSKDKQLQVVKEEIGDIRDRYPSPRKSRLVYTTEEASGLISASKEKRVGEKCTLVYTEDCRFKALVGKEVNALQKPLEGRFKGGLLAKLALETATDKRVFAFTNFGNCYKLDIYSPEVVCPLSGEGAELSSLVKGAVEGEKAVALFEIPERMPIGNLMFFTKKGMIKKTAWADYEDKKESFPAIKLAEDDELLTVEEETDEDDTIIIVTKNGICLNAKKDDVPVQGVFAMGVRGIQLREGDSVVLMKQINGEGEIVLATDEGKFKRVITSQIDVTGRYKKGSVIVGMREGGEVLSASYVTNPYKLAVVVKGNIVSELSTEEVFILMQSARAKKISRYEEGTVTKVIPMPYKKAD